MLHCFLDAHGSALSCLASLHGQLSSSEDHIRALKRELSAACTREELSDEPALRREELSGASRREELGAASRREELGAALRREEPGATSRREDLLVDLPSLAAKNDQVGLFLLI